MNILYVNHYAGSLSLGMEFRPYYLAREWVKAGHRVRIIGASFSHLRVKQPMVSKDFEIQRIDGIEYQWVKTCSYGHNGVARAISMFQFCGKLLWHAEEIAEEFCPDVVIGSSTYTFDTYPCQRIRNFSNKLKKSSKSDDKALNNRKASPHCLYIHENHDIWPLTLTSIGGMNPRHPFCLLNEAGLKSALKQADEVVCVLPFAYEYFKEFGFTDMKRFHHIPNGVALEDWEHPETLPEEHKKIFVKLQGKFVVLYVGGHALSNRLELLIEVAEKLRDHKEIAFVLVGNGVEKDKLMSIAAEKDCSNVYFLPAVNKKAVPTLLSYGSVLYVGAEASPITQYGAGLNKVYDYMMASKPVLYAVSSPNQEVADAGCGWVSPSDDAELIYENILQATELSCEELRVIGNRGREWVLNNCEYKALANKFISLICGK
ncbi:MAG: glycosyltransferase family 4 protein [Selenomonadaceae bacterium]|nr:glycosyltransferase family 4 protein [Selenomonadaceae bacterium]